MHTIFENWHAYACQGLELCMLALQAYVSLAQNILYTHGALHHALKKRVHRTLFRISLVYASFACKTKLF